MPSSPFSSMEEDRTHPVPSTSFTGRHQGDLSGESGDPSAATAADAPSSSSYAASAHEEEGEGRGSGGGVVVVDEVEEEDRFRHHEIEQQQRPLFGFNFRRNNFIVFEDESSVIRDDTWSCVIVVLTFWFFVSMTLILGVYGSVTLLLGPNSSILIEPNSIFVQSLKVEELDDTKPQLMLYGFLKTPELDVTTTWYQSHNASVPADSHQARVLAPLSILSLPKGDIGYGCLSRRSSLCFTECSKGFSQWLEDPTYLNITLSWNLVNGAGTIRQVIYKSSSYYIAVENLNYEEVEVLLDVSVKAYLYNTTEAYYKCTFLRGKCSFSIRFPSSDVAVLATQAPGPSTPSDDWHIKVSYGPRWITYIVGVGGMTVLMLLAFNFLNKFRCGHEDSIPTPNLHMESERAPLLMYKDDDLSSWGSSYDSASQDEAEIEEMLAAQAPEGKILKGGENGNNTRWLCGICFDAPRDCFFLPCGHCVACFDCGLRYTSKKPPFVQASGTCPVCRRNIKEVRRIFTV
ncbi:hypothetical protein MLD38_020393 [Melastoma candidum]|uniref:Uncharacterized protein n=1 Tax=Melastoma candidum TaxID=119954 RepID=A0ACB9QFT5_9MYRT|nr:hypothetical protein MLD38_020393 [Melastoma candidum]